MSSGGKRAEKKNPGETITLDDNAILEAIILYVQERHKNGRVVDVEWLLEPVEGHELPPIKGISVRCLLE
jgi:hypothetical protein